VQIGHHVSISGSLANAVTNANERECSAFQIFTGNPRGWYTKDITDEERKTGEKPITKLQLVSSLAARLELKTDELAGLEKAPKGVLKLLCESL
jgi:deoxyribonuclease-4